MPDQDLLPANVQVSNNVVEELQRRVARAEATLVQKEEENASLKKQLQQYEMRWSDYEAKMRSMEDMWQKQISSLQVSFCTFVIYSVKFHIHTPMCNVISTFSDKFTTAYNTNYFLVPPFQRKAILAFLESKFTNFDNKFSPIYKK